MTASRSIDLHNFTVAEALREFVRFYNACIRSGYRGRVEVIHGYGSNGTGGTIKHELRAFLKAYEEIFGEFLPGESLRNPGVTVLYVKETLAPLQLGQGTMPASSGSSRSFNAGPARKGKRRF